VLEWLLAIIDGDVGNWSESDALGNVQQWYYLQVKYAKVLNLANFPDVALGTERIFYHILV
jgi:hypothetical protein